MHIKLTKHIFGDLEMESSKLVGVYGPKCLEKGSLSESEIKDCIRNPIGASPLSVMARGCKNVLIVTDDNTRTTPLIHILPHVLNELKAAEVAEKDITFLIGLGTHRPMTNKEMEDKFGRDIACKYRIVNHRWDEEEELISIGMCDLGFEIVMNRLTMETDLLISVGSIVPHATTGFSGGGKTIMPGICGEKTIQDTHWMAVNYSMSEILGNLDNPIRDAINSICRKVKLRMIVNSVLFDGGKIFGLVAGDLELAHKEGVDFCKEVYGVPIPQKADIVIAEAYPTDIDLRQAIKAICSADLVCRDGGVIILVGECQEGVAPQFPEFSTYGFSQPETLYRAVENGRFCDKLMAYTLVAIGRIISKRVKSIIVSPNISRNVAEKMGFVWSKNLQNAYSKATQLVGKSSGTIVLRQAGELLPIIQA